jgi:hypothetical protein
MEGRRLYLSDIPSVLKGFILISVDDEGVSTKSCGWISFLFLSVKYQPYFTSYPSRILLFL